jgi:hypothetical protein
LYSQLDKKNATYTVSNTVPLNPESVKPFLIEAAEFARSAKVDVTFLHKGLRAGNAVELSICPTCTPEKIIETYTKKLAEITPRGTGQGDLNILTPEGLRRL